jgi:hypothetical protein
MRPRWLIVTVHNDRLLQVVPDPLCAEEIVIVRHLTACVTTMQMRPDVIAVLSIAWARQWVMPNTLNEEAAFHSIPYQVPHPKSFDQVKGWLGPATLCRII